MEVLNPGITEPLFNDDYVIAVPNEVLELNPFL